RQLQSVLLDRAREFVGDDHRLRDTGDRLLPRRRRARATRPQASPGVHHLMSAVVIKDVSKSFHAGVTALTDINLTVEPREFVSLIGPSGCGKSTLLRIIGDLAKPSSGSVAVNGKSATQARREHEYGIVFQDAVLYDWRSVAKNISLPLELLGWSRARRAARVRDMISLVELSGFENHHP